jgi:CheY-like chemotaxis protein
MEEGIAGKIFDPFFTTKPSAKHKGLGLSIGYGIVKDHEGQIKARSQKGKGASLEISFPLWTDRGLAKKAGKDIGRGRGERIMIVDDEEPLLETLEELLAGLGYKTISVESGSRAIDVYQKWQPKAVVLDRHMPGMDGLATSEALLALDPEAKIILASGYDEAGPNGIDDHIGKSIKGYLTKPFDIKQLSHLLAEVIER